MLGRAFTHRVRGTGNISCVVMAIGGGDEFCCYGRADCPGEGRVEDDHLRRVVEMACIMDVPAAIGTGSEPD